jgi:hypothetical protein
MPPMPQETAQKQRENGRGSCAFPKQPSPKPVNERKRLSITTKQFTILSDFPFIARERTPDVTIGRAFRLSR